MVNNDHYLHVKIITPEKVLYSDIASMVVIPGIEGECGILFNHVPLMSAVEGGVVRVYLDQKIKHEIFVRQGFSQVLNNKVIILAEFALDIGDYSIQDTKNKLEQYNMGQSKLQNSTQGEDEHILMYRAILNYLEYRQASAKN